MCVFVRLFVNTVTNIHIALHTCPQMTLELIDI